MVWTPGNVHAQVYVPSRAHKQRKVFVAVNSVTELGNIRKEVLTLESIDEEQSVAALKAQLLTMPPLTDLQPERLALYRWGSEVSDEKLLREIANCSDVELSLKIRRRCTVATPRGAAPAAATGGGVATGSGPEAAAVAWVLSNLGKAIALWLVS